MVVNVRIRLLVNLRLRLVEVVLVIASVRSDALDILNHVVRAIATRGRASTVRRLLLGGRGERHGRSRVGVAEERQQTTGILAQRASDQHQVGRWEDLAII